MDMALYAASEPFGIEPADVADSMLLDVRRAALFEQAPSMLPGARWHDPTQVQAWAAGLPRDTPITVYCVHGHELSRSAVLHLRGIGLQARFLRGGIEAWVAAGWPTQNKHAR